MRERSGSDGRAGRRPGPLVVGAWRLPGAIEVRELHRGWGHFIPRVIWCLAIALFIAVWIYVALQTNG